MTRADLDYPDPPPPPDLLPRIAREARRVRRRRRAAGAVAVVAAVATTALAGTAAGGLLADDEPPPPAVEVDLPPAHKNARAMFTYPDGARQWVYRDRDPHPPHGPVSCSGDLPVPGQVVASCQSAGDFDAPGPQLGFGSFGSQDVAGHPAPSGKRRVSASGSFGGPVTRVAVRVAGHTAEASLARDADWRVGATTNCGRRSPSPCRSWRWPWTASSAGEPRHRRRDASSLKATPTATRAMPTRS